MASLRDSVKDYQEELRDGIAWVAFWKQGRSWNAELFHLEVDGTFPLRPSASCGRAHFVFFKTFLKNFSIPFGKSAVRPWKAAERG